MNEALRSDELAFAANVLNTQACLPAERMRRTPVRRYAWLFLVGSLLFPPQAKSAEPKLIYENNFEKAEVGKVPEDFLVLEGAFAVKEESGNKFLELPGAPLDTFGLLFGPTESEGMVVSARVYGTAKG